MMKTGLLIACLFASSAWAQTASLDSKKPIEITADELEVLQNEQKAIFRGNVLAEQGEITMKSVTMTVFYRSGGEEAAGAASAAQGIKRIEAGGGVFFSTPQETAQGNSAIYDVDAEEIRMIGEVMLTREKNVVRGNQLVYNLKTGRSVLSSAMPAGQKTPGGRVKGLFVPKQGQ